MEVGLLNVDAGLVVGEKNLAADSLSELEVSVASETGSHPLFTTGKTRVAGFELEETGLTELVVGPDGFEKRGDGVACCLVTLEYKRLVWMW